MEAAFVDIGRGRNGVLYAGEVNWEAAGLGGANRKIEQALKPGDYVVVQVSKDPVGHKGARLTTQVSLAGRYLVYVPGASSAGISRKLPDTERQRLKDILREVVPAGAGVIIRTASEGVKEDDIRTDVNRLQERWATIAEEAERVKANKAGAAIALYEEPDVLWNLVGDHHQLREFRCSRASSEADQVRARRRGAVRFRRPGGFGRPGRVRGVPHRRTVGQGDGPQGVVALRRHPGHRPH
jgi:ribonuclease E